MTCIFLLNHHTSAIICTHDHMQTNIKCSHLSNRNSNFPCSTSARCRNQFPHPPTTRDFYITIRHGPTRPGPVRLGPGTPRPDLTTARYPHGPVTLTHRASHYRPKGLAGPIRLPLRLALARSGPQDPRPQRAPARHGLSSLTRISHGPHG